MRNTTEVCSPLWTVEAKWYEGPTSNENNARTYQVYLPEEAALRRVPDMPGLSSVLEAIGYMAEAGVPFFEQEIGLRVTQAGSNKDMRYGVDTDGGIFARGGQVGVKMLTLKRENLFVERKPVPTVWVLNDTGKYDLSAAKVYGRLTSVLRGKLNVFSHLDDLRGRIETGLSEFVEGDYLLLSGHALTIHMALDFLHSRLETVNLLVYGAQRDDYRVVELRRSNRDSNQ